MSATRTAGCAALVCAALSFTAAAQTPTATVQVSAYRVDVYTGVGAIALTEVPAGAQILVKVQYTVSNLGAGQASVQLDLCDPGPGNVSLPSGGTSAPLNCRDGYWNDNSGRRITSPPITSATGNQSATGVFSAQMILSDGVVPDGSLLNIPVRVLVGGTSLGDTVFSLPVRARTLLQMQMRNYEIAAQPNPVNGTPGYRVSFLVDPINSPNYELALFAAGTTTITVPTPAGGVYLDTIRTGSPPSWWAGWPRFVAANLNNSFTTAYANGVATLTEQNLLSGTFARGAEENAGSFVVRYWFPDNYGTISISANASWDTQTATASASAYLGKVTVYVAKSHFCPARGFSYFYSAHGHALNEDRLCYTSPLSPQWRSVYFYGAGAGGTSRVFDLQIVDKVLDDEELYQVIGSVNTTTGKPIPGPDPYFQLSYSTDSSCSQATTQWTASPLPVDLTPIRCLKWSGTGIFPNNDGGVQYLTRLKSAKKIELAAAAGNYATYFSDLWINASNAQGYAGFAQAPPVTTTPDHWGHASENSTYWNSAIALVGSYLDDSTLAPPNMRNYLAAGPMATSTVTNHLTARIDYPPEIDVTGPPVHNSATPPLIGGDGLPTHPTCTWSAKTAQSNAWVQCVWPAGVPALLEDPYSTCGTDPSRILSCFDGNANDLAGKNPFNASNDIIPLRLLYGYGGQVLPILYSAWDETTAPPDGAFANGTIPYTTEEYPSYYASHFAHAGSPYYFNYTIHGLENLIVQQTALQAAAVAGTAVQFAIHYANTGKVGTSGTYLYDLFNRNSVTGASLGAGCSTALPTLQGIVQQSGATNDLAYTTDLKGPTDSSWIAWNPASPPALGSVTGLRLTLNTSYNNLKGVLNAGESGDELLTLTAPNEPGANVCNAPAIGATSLSLSGAALGVTLIQSAQTTPTVTWPTPADIVYGTPLGQSQLDASASVAGSYAYTPPAGTVLNAGAGQQLSVIFTPADTTHYTAATTSVLINVTPAPLTVTAADATRIYGTDNGTLSASISGFVNGDTGLAGSASLATAATSASPVGNYPIVASQGSLSSPNYSFSFVNGTLHVVPSATNVTLSSSLNPAIFGDGVVFTATVAAAAPGSGTPTGSVSFFDGDQFLGSGTLTNGAATFATSDLAVGTHPITASYGGDANFLSQVSAPLAQVINAIPTTTVVTSSSNPSLFGEAVTLSATVSSGSGTPDGSVDFSVDGAFAGTATLSPLGIATLDAPVLAVAAHGVTASYSGATRYLPSAGDMVQVVQDVPPVAQASASVASTCPGAVVTLSGNTSGGTHLSYAWTQVDGAPVALDGANTASPSFVAPNMDGTVSFTLTVSNGAGSSTSAPVIVVLHHANQAPVSLAYTQQPQVVEGTIVTIDGSASYDPDAAPGDQLAFAWVQTGGDQVTLSDASAAKPTFTAPSIPGGDPTATRTYSFKVTVTDKGSLCGGPLSATSAAMTVTVQNVDHPPLADAGPPQTVNKGKQVALAGTGSDPDGDNITYAWTQLSGPAVALSDAASPAPAFTAPAPSASGPATLVFQLIVTDQYGLASIASTVTITVKDQPPACSGAFPMPQSIWPPNHKNYLAIGIGGVTDPDDPASSVAVTVTSVFQDEPVNSLGDGNTPVDAYITNGAVTVHAERAGTRNGRVYTIGFKADDGGGGTCTGTVRVCVPHDHSPLGSICIDDGPIYDSTKPMTTTASK